jgi:hypothetical protein
MESTPYRVRFLTVTTDAAVMIKPTTPMTTPANVMRFGTMYAEKALPPSRFRSNAAKCLQVKMAVMDSEADTAETTKPANPKKLKPVWEFVCGDVASLGFMKVWLVCQAHGPMRHQDSRQIHGRRISGSPGRWKERKSSRLRVKRRFAPAFRAAARWR